MTIEWYGDKQQQSHKCYEFLFDEFKRFYLAYMFPNTFQSFTTTNTSTSNNNSSNSIKSPHTPPAPAAASTAQSPTNAATPTLLHQQQSLNVFSHLNLCKTLGLAHATQFVCERARFILISLCVCVCV